MIKVLNVAEKPSVAKSVATILSRNQLRVREGRSRYNKIFEFNYSINGQQCHMLVTSFTGHLMEVDFEDRFRKWHSCDPADLYTAPVRKHVPEDKLDIKRTLEEEARKCHWLVLWLDCDREGENIAFEVMEVCKGVNRNLTIRRARFSALIERDIHEAAQNLIAPNQWFSDAVDARQEIDLRIGASFTRFQTMLLRDRFVIDSAQDDKNLVLSYGPCQFPTLGFVVERYWEIQSHEPEEDGMWKIGGVGKYSLNQDHCEEFVAFGDTWSADYSMNEDIFSSHLVDVMGQGTLRSVTTLSILYIYSRPKKSLSWHFTVTPGLIISQAKEESKNRIGNLLVVAVLVAGVTFAGVVQLPQLRDNNYSSEHHPESNSTITASRYSSYENHLYGYLFLDVGALSASMVAALILLWASFISDAKFILLTVKVSALMVFLAIIMMFGAFILSVRIALLESHEVWLRMAITVVAVVFFLVQAFLFLPWIIPRSVNQFLLRIILRQFLLPLVFTLFYCWRWLTEILPELPVLKKNDAGVSQEQKSKS